MTTLYPEKSPKYQVDMRLDTKISLYKRRPLGKTTRENTIIMMFIESCSLTNSFAIFNFLYTKTET